jgi:hypothetical protein
LAHHFIVDVQPFDQTEDGSSGQPPEANYGQLELEVHELIGFSSFALK